MNLPDSIFTIIARGGARLCLHQFGATGYDARGSDPATLMVRRRLPKGWTFLAPCWERRRFGTPPLANAAIPSAPFAELLGTGDV